MLICLLKKRSVLLFIIIFVFFTYLFISQVYSRKIDLLYNLKSIESNGYIETEQGILYLPIDWNESKPGGWPVTIILPGYYSRAQDLYKNPQWQKQADKLGIVLLFIKRDHQGWYEGHGSEDTIKIDSIVKSIRKSSWFKKNSLHLFGFSAGGMMATSYLVHKSNFISNKPFFDKVSIISGGIGIEMKKYIHEDPMFNKVSKIPVLICWGENEANTVTKKLYTLLNETEWNVNYSTHPKGHIITDLHIKESLLFSVL